ncbi:hypothetical protein [Rhizohabitans arisaemae]|uniref:hypothetical protein n=1 Tax=Rhizohabitans arisaemae TaxID=2720610 RepID=UPI0024B1F4D2|nr:hypothetical protein [Rhizohabitans arisaemae]
MRVLAVQLVTTEGRVEPGIVAFLIVAALALALVFLIKSMNKQISKIEVPHKDEDGDDREDHPAASPKQTT